MRFDDRVCSGWFAVEQGLRHACVLAPLLFNIFFAAVMNAAYTRFQGGKRHHGRFGAAKKQNGGGAAEGSNHQRAVPGDIAVGYALR